MKWINKVRKNYNLSILMAFLPIIGLLLWIFIWGYGLFLGMLVVLTLFLFTFIIKKWMEFWI